MNAEQWWQDLRLAWRGLRRARGFTMAAVLTLAVGIAGATVMFSLIEGVLLRPLPVRQQDRLLVAWKASPAAGLAHFPFRVPEIDAIRRESTLLEDVAAVGYNGAGPSVAVERGSASYISTAAVTADFFRVVGIDAILGRTLSREDDVTGAEDVVVITDALWQRRYGRARDVIGRRLTIDQQPFTIVGVAPPDFALPRGVEAWMTTAASASTLTNPAFREGARNDVDLIARLRPGATLEQARSELHALMPQLDRIVQTRLVRGLEPVVHSYADVVVGDVRRAMLVLFGAVGLILFIATANVANLLLLRGESRRSEFAVRAALGAGHARLARQVLVESVLLAAAAGVVGLTVTAWALPIVIALVPDGLPRPDSVHVDARVVLFTFTLVFLTAALAGLAPALHSARADLVSRLRSGERGNTSREVRHGRRLLVIAQVALAVTIVAAAGLLIRSLLRLQAVDMGLAADHLAFLDLDLPQGKYADDTRHLKFLNDLVSQLEAAPGIAAATPVNTPPFAGTNGWDLPVFTADGQSAERARTNPSLNIESVHPGYFETFEIGLVRGRTFTPADRQGAPEVAIVSEDVAARTWPGEDPIGKRLKFGEVDSRDPWRTVVGVARPTRYRELARARPTLYLPAEQFIVAAHTLVVRTSLPTTRVAALARDRVRAVDPGVLVIRVAPFGELLETPLARPRFNTFLIGVFGVMALLLSAMGLYAVMGASVRQRYAEIGIRVALGATASDVRRLVLGEGLRLAGVGAAIGLAGATIAGGLLRGLLFEIRPLDPASLLTAAFLLIAVSGLVCYLPARRASRLDPIATLRAN